MLLSQLVEEIERIETTKNQFGKVMEQIKGTINLTKFPGITSSIIEPGFTKKIEPTSLAGLRIAGID